MDCFPRQPKGTNVRLQPVTLNTKECHYPREPGWEPQVATGSQPNGRGTVAGSLQSLLCATWAADFHNVRGSPGSGFPNNPPALLRNRKLLLKYLNNAVEGKINCEGCYSIANAARQCSAWQTTKLFPEKTQIQNSRFIKSSYCNNLSSNTSWAIAGVHLLLPSQSGTSSTAPFRHRQAGSRLLESLSKNEFCLNTEQVRRQFPCHGCSFVIAVLNKPFH